MSGPLVWDIETVPLASALAEPWDETEWTAPSNIKDPLKIEERRERAKAEWEAKRAKECALNPRLGRIVAVGISNVDNADGDAVVVAPTEEHEKILLAGLWERIAQANGQIVTFNGTTFDVPYLICRSWKNGVKPTVPVKIVQNWQRRYSSQPHYDCRAVLTQWDTRASGTLTDWATFADCYTPQTVTGKDIGDLYNAGDFAAIEKHCRDDVVSTKSLYLSMTDFYGPVGAGW